MTSRVKKHDHELQVISHTEDWSKVLVNCKDVECNLTEVVKPTRGKGAQFVERMKSYRHLCCEPA